MKIRIHLASLALLPLSLVAQSLTPLSAENDAIIKDTLATDPSTGAGRTTGASNRRLSLAQDSQDARQVQLNQAINAVSTAGGEQVEAVDERTGTAIIKSKDGTAIRLQKIVGRAHGADASQAQVISYSSLDAAKRAEMVEDMNVMAKLLDDAIADQRDTAAPHAMGINVSTFALDGSTPRSLYIDGHGAIFHAAVRFPLKPAEKQEKTVSSKPLTNSAWEAARKDLYGRQEEEAAGWGNRSEGRAEEYSEERVESLKQSVLKALGNGNNFRHVKGDETITVVIRDRGVGGSRRAGLPLLTTRSAPAGSGGSSGFGITSGTMGSTFSSRLGEWGVGGDEQTMTIRVKKSDADSLANGRINEQDFRKRATITVY